MDHVAIMARMHRWALTGALALVPVIVAAQAQLHYDAKQQAEQQRMEMLYVQTIECLHTSTLAILRQGVRDPAAVRTFNLSFCGAPLHNQLTQRMGWEPRDAKAFLVRLSDMTVTNITR